MADRRGLAAALAGALRGARGVQEDRIGRQRELEDQKAQQQRLIQQLMLQAKLQDMVSQRSHQRGEESDIAAEQRAEALALAESLGAARAGGVRVPSVADRAGAVGPKESAALRGELGTALSLLERARAERAAAEESREKRIQEREDLEAQEAGAMARAEAMAGARSAPSRTPIELENGNLGLLDTRSGEIVDTGQKAKRAGSARDETPELREEARNIVATQMAAEIETTGTKEAKKKLERARGKTLIAKMSLYEAMLEEGLLSPEEAISETQRWVDVMLNQGQGAGVDLEAQLAEASSNIKRLETIAASLVE